MSNYATRKESVHATGVDISDLVVKKDFVALKDEVDKIDIDKLVNVPMGLKILKIREDDDVVGKLKDNQFVKNTKFNTLKTKFKKVFWRNYLNSYKSTIYNSYTVRDTKIRDLDKKIPDLSGLVKKTDSDPKISETERNYFTTSDYNKFVSHILMQKTKKNYLTNMMFLTSWKSLA